MKLYCTETDRPRRRLPHKKPRAVDLPDNRAGLPASLCISKKTKHRFQTWTSSLLPYSIAKLGRHLFTRMVTNLGYYL